MKILAIFIACLFPVLIVSGQNSIFVENQSIASDYKITPVLKVQAQHMAPGKTLGFNAFFLVNPDWAEAVVGITWAPKLKGLDVFNLTCNVGVQTYAIPWYTQVGSYLEKGKFSNLAVFEYGHTGYWYLIVPEFKITKLLGLGTHAERFVGIGPQTSFHIGSGNVWLNPAYDLEEDKWKMNMGVNVFL